MFKQKAHLRAALLLLPLSSGIYASSNAIGVATANGKFSLNHAIHQNNATLFEGNAFDSGTSEMELRLANGAIIQLGAATSGTVFRDHISIQNGGGDVRGGSAYSVEALKLQIKPSQQSSVARVMVDGGRVRVGALKGELKVSNEQGVLVATIAQGNADAFTPLGDQADRKGTAAPEAAAGAAAATTGVIAAGTTAAGVSTAVVVAGVAVAGAGTAVGITLAASSSNSAITLSPAAR